MAPDWATRERLWLQTHKPFSPEQLEKSEAPPLSDGFSDFHNYVIDMLQILLFQEDVDLTDQAKAIATRFCRQRESEDAWSDFLISLVSAAMETSDDEALRRLALLLTALTRQPDARNLSGGSITVDGILGRPREIPPGEIIDFGGVRLFSGLPDFAMLMRETWNGPKSMTRSKWDSPEAARLAWTNINAFLAQLSRVQRDTPGEPFALWLDDFGLWTITDGLESVNGIEDHTRAATRWFLILGDIIHSDATWGGREGPAKGPGRPSPLRGGPLWRAEISRGASQSERWGFWKQRLGKIAEDKAIGRETREIAAETARHMAQVE